MFFTQKERTKLIDNGRASQGNDKIDHVPVVKLFTPDGNATWLLSELYPAEPNVAFGLCDLGLGFPELGDVCLSELEALRGRLGLPVERDRHFRPTKTISAYAAEARQNQRIVA